MTDPFAELGLPQRFDLDPAALAAAAQKSGDSPAYKIVADPRSRADALLNLMAGPYNDWKGIPDDFPAALAAAGNDPVKLAALRDQRLANIASYFHQLRGHDPGGVQAGRQRQVRAELNAIAQIPG